MRLGFFEASTADAVVSAYARPPNTPRARNDHGSAAKEESVEQAPQEKNRFRRAPYRE
ncbi:hypothetical protein [Sulfodiicoccus acidiphilus]|uniref:hypothetical protein n=1 Tax=Sulfodiicoccus acidiphilus TaxID=1670455 RepID=UPI0013159F6D|nr:hypothetical protein [Sulfodiicoccus acidiphilus]